MLPTLGYESCADLKKTWNNTKFDYGGPGLAGANLNKLINNASDEQWQDIRSGLAELCFGDDIESRRIDADVEKISGLGHVIATRMLTICYSQSFIPNYVLHRDGKYGGKLDAINVLDRLGLLDTDQRRHAHALLREHQSVGDTGSLVVQANDLLLGKLKPHFSHEGVADTWGILKFLYWLMERYPSGNGVPVRPNDEPVSPWISPGALAELSEGLLCDVGFLAGC